LGTSLARQADNADDAALPVTLLAPPLVLVLPELAMLLLPELAMLLLLLLLLLLPVMMLLPVLLLFFPGAVRGEDEYEYAMGEGEEE
jgi:hypothetical protein